MNWLLKHWQGQYSLAVSFWVNTVLVNFILSLPFSFLFIGLLQAGEGNLFLRVLLNYQLFHIFVSVWQAVGVYRASARSESRGRTFWVFAARVAVIVWTANAVLSVLMIWQNSAVVLEMWLKVLQAK